LTDLVTNNTLYYVAYATNSLGTSYGDTLSFEVKNSPCGDLTSLMFDGYDYDVVSIGDQCWFAENLRSENYNDGSPIPYETADETWENLTTGARAVYEHEGSSFETYGALYNWYAVDDPRGLCPTGWHVPILSDISTFKQSIGNSANNAKSSPTDTPSWNGTNASGWSGLPGGQRFHAGNFAGMGDAGHFWISEGGGSTTHAHVFTLKTEVSWIDQYFFDLNRGLSVRCLRDE
jgi:uncharacterized protein (TIGR02145 family)